MFAFDNDNDGFTGQYRAYVDDFKVFYSTPLVQSKPTLRIGLTGSGFILFLEQGKPIGVKTSWTDGAGSFRRGRDAGCPTPPRPDPYARHYRHPLFWTYPFFPGRGRPD
jgi:hypothetical protein